MESRKEVESFYLDTDILKLYNERINNSINNLGTSKEDTSNNFKKLKDNNIYRGGFNNIERGIGETKDTLLNSYRVNEEFVDRFIRLEEKGQSLVREIEIPKVFSTNGSSRTTGFSSVSINKNDGTSVKSGTLVNSIEDDSYNQYKELIDNIKKDENGEEYTEEYSQVTKQEIDNIEKELEDSVEESNYDVQKESMSNVNVGEKDQQYKDEQQTSVVEAILGDVKKEKEETAVPKDISIEDRIELMSAIKPPEFETVPMEVIEDDNQSEI